MNRFLIIDGSSMLTTNYYATLPKEVMFAKTDEDKEKHYPKIMHSEDGTYTNAIFGTLKMIKKIIEHQKPTHIAVVFDQTRETFRRRMFADYKGQRKSSPEPLKQQFQLIEELLPHIGIKTLYSPEFEADDYAGSLARKYESADTRIYLMSKDQDYLQLVNDYTRLWMPFVKKEKVEEYFSLFYYPFGISKEEINLPDKVFEFTPQLVKEVYGLEPKQIIDMKAIGGDSSDNIPGVKGVSDETAVKLLQEYGSVENLYSLLHSIDVKDKSQLKDLNTFWKEELGISRSPFNMLMKTSEDSLVGEAAAILSKSLATIKCDIPLSCTLSDYKTVFLKDAFKEICTTYNMKSLL